MFAHEGDYEKLCLQINYQFRNEQLLAQAITTKSGWNNRIPRATIGHQEELAFFGDSLLRMVIDKILMEEFPYYEIGELSRARDLLVRNTNLIEAAKRLSLENFIIMDDNQKRQCATSQPKLLADTMEAIICAIYKDSGDNLHEVRNFILANSNIANALKLHQENEQQRCLPLVHAISHLNESAVKQLIAQDIPVNSIFVQPDYEVVDTEYCPEVIEHEIFITPLGYAVHCVEILARAEKDVTPAINVIHCLLQKGANSNLTPKKQQPLTKSLMYPVTFDGRRADPFFASFMAIKPLPTEMTQSLDKELVPNWEKITDTVFELLCKFGADLNVSDYHTLFELAIIFKQSRKLELLFQFKANVNITNRSGDTPLHVAAEHGNLTLVRQLLSAGANPECCNNRGEKAFDLANKAEIKIALLKAEILCTEVSVTNIQVDEINHQAVILYQTGIKENAADKLAQATQLFSLILKHGLQAKNYQDEKLVSNFYNLGATYLQRRNYPKAKMYLERANYLYLINENKFNPKTTKFADRLKECEAYLKAQEKESPSKEVEKRNQLSKTAAVDGSSTASKQDQELFDAVSYYHLERAKNALSNGANPDAVSVKGEPILIYAIHQYASTSAMADATSDLPYNHVGVGSFPKQVLRIIQLLLEYGADTNKRDKRGCTALHAAASINKYEIVSLLLKHHADPKLKNPAGDYPSHLAKKNNVRRLILQSLLPKTNVLQSLLPKTNAAVEQAELKNPTSPTTSSSKPTVIKMPVQQPTDMMAKPSAPTLFTSAAKPAATPTAKAIAKPQSKPSAKPSVNKSKNEKTVLCKFFKEGNANSCRNGDHCKFAHGEHEKQAYRRYNNA